MACLLLVYHSQSGHTRQLAEAVERGVARADTENLELRVRQAFDADADDLLWADGLLLGTPENFGYMSGAVKDFLDRTYYQVEDRLAGRPYALFISCANDGRGAAQAIQRIMNGYAMKEVQDPLICRGRPKPEHHSAAEELGEAIATGLDAGIF